MRNAYIVTGTLTNERTVTLDEALPLSSIKVRLVVEPLAAVSARPYHEIMAAVRERQVARGHRPSTTEEVDAYLQAERGFTNPVGISSGNVRLLPAWRSRSRARACSNSAAAGAPWNTKCAKSSGANLRTLL